MPPARGGRRSRAQYPRGRGRSNAAAAQHAVAGGPHGLGIPQQVAPPAPPNLILLLPAELRTTIYDFFIPGMRKVVLDTSKPTIAIGEHPLAETCKAIRSEFLARVRETHRARFYIVEVRDFDFGRLMYHLRQNGRLDVNNLRLRIRLSVTKPEIDITKLLAWFAFLRRHVHIPKYAVWEMPPVAVRRVFMTQVFRLWEDLRRVWDEIKYVMKPFMNFWDRGKGEMKWAQPDEQPPMGEDWERSAGTDVDSSGEESEEDEEGDGDEEDEAADDG